MQLRPYRGNDFRFLERSFGSYVRESARYDPEVRPRPDPRFGGAYARSLVRLSTKRGGLFLIAVVGRDRPVGFIVGRAAPLSRTERLAIKPGIRPCVGYELYVTPRYRRQGIGRRLLEEFERHFGRYGYTQVRFGVHAKNRSAIQLYRSMGFSDRAWFLGRPIRARNLKH